MSKFLVLDVVFFGGSMNYDQGAGNYNEIKKIKWWDGSVRVIVSKYALRYSILHTGEKFFGWELAKGENELAKTGENSGKGGIHPKEDLFKNKKIIDFPEFDLFGYLITKSGRNNQSGKQYARSASVKLTHAVSLTKFGFDTHFNANLDLSKRYSKDPNKFKPAPFTTEEFMGFYIYNVTIDLDKIGKFEKHEIPSENNDCLELEESKKCERIETLLKVIMNLKRDVRGMNWDLSPWLVVAGYYENEAYDTYFDKISLNQEKEFNIETEIEEKQDPERPGKTKKTIRYKETKDVKAVFKIQNLNENVEVYAREDIKISNLSNKNPKNNKEEFIDALMEKIKFNEQNCKNKKDKGGKINE